MASPMRDRKKSFETIVENDDEKPATEDQNETRINITKEHILKIKNILLNLKTSRNKCLSKTKQDTDNQQDLIEAPKRQPREEKDSKCQLIDIANECVDKTIEQLERMKQQKVPTEKEVSKKQQKKKATTKTQEVNKDYRNNLDITKSIIEKSKLIFKKKEGTAQVDRDSKCQLTEIANEGVDKKKEQPERTKQKKGPNLQSEKDVTKKQQRNNTTTKTQAVTKDNTNKLDETEEYLTASDIEKSKLVFQKKDGTAQVEGQLYETKLITLIYLRTKLDKEITKFYIASNIDGIGALDDICFRFKSNGNKDALVFIQTKHRNKISEKTNITMNDVKDNSGDYGLVKYFKSHLEIREKITSNKMQHYLYEGNSMYELDCNYIVYTPAGHSINSTDNAILKKVKPSAKIHSLIETKNDGDIFQFNYERVSFILEDYIEKRFEELAKMFLDILFNGNVKFVDHELMKCYQAVLLNYVIDTSDDSQGTTRTCQFRPSFFESNEKYTSLFREKLYNEVIKNKLSLQPTAKENSSSTTEESAADRMSNVIRFIMRYDPKTNQLSLIKGSLEQNYDQFGPTSCNFTKIVVEIAAKTILESTFNVPIEFVNSDIQIRNTRRQLLLTDSLLYLFKIAQDKNGVNIIEVNENMLSSKKLNPSVFNQNGGLGSAVGNLFVIDQETNTFKINKDNLPKNAKELWGKINEDQNLMKIEKDLMTYRFRICVNGFPRVSFEDVAIDEYMVKDFLNKLWFYTGQNQEHDVETKAKDIIKSRLIPLTIPNSIFDVSSDAIYLTVHDCIQKWWMKTQKYCITESLTLLDDPMSKLVKNPILTVLNIFCVNKLINIGMEFNVDAIKSLNINEFVSGLLNIITKSNVLTGAKLKQHFKGCNDHVFIDFNYVVNFFLFSYDQIQCELSKKNINTIIIIYESIENNEFYIQALRQFVQKFNNRKIIIVSNKRTNEQLQKGNKMLSVRIDNNNLNDLSVASQEKVLSESTVIFQGDEMTLKTIITNDSKHLITSDILHKLVTKEVFEIGNPLTTPNYDKIKQFYVDRTLDTLHLIHYIKGKKPNPQELSGVVSKLNMHYARIICIRQKHKINDSEFTVDANNLFINFNDNNIKIITAPPGMGKSTLLTHMSVVTKKDHPDIWIARINMTDYSKQFRNWNNTNNTIDKTETLRFLCKAVTRGKDKDKIEFTNDGNDIILKRDNLGVNDLLELDMFIHCCKTGRVIFVFDGFDEICPLYESVGIQLIKNTIKYCGGLANTDEATSSLVKEPIVWIASRSYNDVIDKIEGEFGKSFNLLPLSYKQQSKYLKEFWNEHIKLDQFTNEQLANVKSFIDYMGNFVNNYREITGFTYIKPITIPLYEMYAIAVEFLLDEIKSNPRIGNNELFKKVPSFNTKMLNSVIKKTSDKFKGRYNSEIGAEASPLAGSPLHLHIAADNFQSEIKYGNSRDKPDVWNLDINTFSFYERFLHTKFTKIQQEEKNKMDTSIADNDNTNRILYEIFLKKHHKLAFYAIFVSSNGWYYYALTTEEERKDITDLVDSVRIAKEKTGLVECVIHDMPTFIHRTFAEYFAIEHICEMLHSAHKQNNLERQKTLWKCILRCIIADNAKGAVFNHKLANDTKFSNIITKEHTQRIVYNIILKQLDSLIRNEDEDNTVVEVALNCYLRETTKFLLVCIQNNIDHNTMKKFTKYIEDNSILNKIVLQGYEDVRDVLLKILGIDNDMVKLCLSRYRVITLMEKRRVFDSETVETDPDLYQPYISLKYLNDLYRRSNRVIVNQLKH